MRKPRRSSTIYHSIIESKKRCVQIGLLSALTIAVLIGVPQVGIACSYFDLGCWTDEAIDYVRDNLKGIASLTWDVITLRPEDAWNDFRDIQNNLWCASLSGTALLFSNGVEAYFHQCAGPPSQIEPEILARLGLYFKSDLKSVRIHEGCSKLPSSRAAITFGEHIYFTPEKYKPGTAAGFATLAHEITHVLQYRKKGFSDFTCEYSANCSFDRYGRDAANLCTIEKEAYAFEDLVKEDQNADGDGIFQRVDNCRRRFNPGQQDFDDNGRGDVCEVPTYFADVNGDGKADAIELSGANGISVKTSDGSSFSGGGRWASFPFYGEEGTFFADVSGDGRADAIAIYYDGIWVQISTGSGFAKPENWTGSAFYGQKGTWFADVDGDRRADVIGVNADAVYIRLSSGIDFPIASQSNWSNGAFFGERDTSFTDINGDGRADAIAVNNDGVLARTSSGGSFPIASHKKWTDGAFYGEKGTFFADVNGDGRADAIAVNNDAIWAGTSYGGKFPVSLIRKWIPGAFYLENSRYVADAFADVNGDGRADAIAVLKNGLWVRASEGGRFPANYQGGTFPVSLQKNWTGPFESQHRYRTNCPAPSPAQIAIYQHNFADGRRGGNCRILDIGSYPNSSFFSPVGDNSISSLDVGSNVEVFLHQSSNFGGSQIRLEGGRGYFLKNADFDERTSSIKVLRH